MAKVVLELRGVNKCFVQKLVLNDINLIAKTGEVIALLGPSGAGKSTLLRCVNLLEIPEQGDVIFAGESIQFRHKGKQRLAKSRQQVLNLRRQVGMVFQQFHLWAHKTVLENVMEAPLHVLKQSKSKVREETMALLDKVGMSDFVNVYPKRLSGGQQQRVAIARALAMHPKLLLFDEPTASLDPERVNEVLNVIKQLAQEGRTMLIATHEMDFAKQVADKICFMEAGEIKVLDTVQALFVEGKSQRFNQFIEK